MPSPRLLVVDDEDSNRRFADRALAPAGYDVTTAASAVEALKEIASQGPFDGYIVDVMMPVVRGTELAETIRQSEPNARILFFTGFADTLFTQRRLLKDNEAFVQKPVGVEELREAVSLLLFGHLRGIEARG